MANRLLLVGWDAADWSILHPLIDAGEMPALCRIIEAGASGQLLCTQPLVAAAQWASLATGKRPWQHRICHPMEGVAPTETIPVTAARRRSLALWEMLAQRGKRSLVVGWPATHGGRTENTVLVSDRYAQPTAGPGTKPWPPAVSGTYWPESIGVRLNHLRVSPEDIQASVISQYVPEWKKIDMKRDLRLGQLRLFLAADFSCQAAMIALLSSGEWDFAAVRFPALGAISQIFLPYRLPRPEWIPEIELGLYQNVIRSACHMLDRMLQLLVQAAGNTASVAVVSAHGVSRHAFLPANVRGGNKEAWKSPHGIFAACGPGFAADALVFGATVLDVAPTILTWFGLPIGDDMEGRVLTEGFASVPEVTRAASWESAQGVTSILIADDGGSQDNPKAAAILQREFDWNLAQSLLEARRCEEALPVLERLFRGFPEWPDLAHALFQCQVALQRLPEAGETLEVLLEMLPAGIWSLLPRAELCLARKEMKQARSLVKEAWDLHPTHPDATRRLGLLLLRLRDWDAVAELARQALKVDENESMAWLGLAEAQLRKRLPVEAEEAALRTIGLNYYVSQAYFVLARALVAQGKWQQADEAIQVFLQFQPKNKAASTYAKRFGKPPQPPSVQEKQQ